MEIPPVENDPLLREVNASVRRRRSSTNSNDLMIDANTQTALSQIKTSFKGAMCDSEGFYQHEGECWNDAIQMVFLFSDGLKEVVQEKLAKNEIDINFIPRKMIPNIISRYKELARKMKVIYNIIIPDLTDEQIIESLVFYLEFLKHRFARHYIMESERREECKPNRNPIKILHTKGKNGIMAAIFGNPSKKEYSLQNYKNKKAAGAKPLQSEYLIDILIYTFFPYVFKYKDLISTTVSRDGFLTYEWILEFCKKRMPYAILLKLSNHMTCFYTCGGNDFFYEDNFGPFLFPWKDVFFKVGLQHSDIISVFFMELKINSYTLTTYYPVIRTKENNYFTYYNTILYNFPQNMFDSKPSSGEPTVYSFDTTITFLFNYEEDKIIILDGISQPSGAGHMLAISKNVLNKSNIVLNKGFTFKRDARINNIYKRKQRAINHGLPLNSPILNWEENNYSFHKKTWYNPNAKIAFIEYDPYEMAQKTPEELRLELKLRGITPAANATKNVLLKELFESREPSKVKRASIQRAINLGLPINSPIIDWIEKTSDDDTTYWYNPMINKLTINDPFEIAQKTSEELRLKLSAHGIILPADASHTILLNTLLDKISVPIPTAEAPVAAPVAAPAPVPNTIKSPSFWNKINPYTRYRKWKNKNKNKNTVTRKVPNSSLWKRINPFRH